MKKCMHIEVKHDYKGSPFTVLQCGGVFIKKGDVITVTRPYGKVIMNQYRGIMRVVKDNVLIERLSGGHYQVNHPLGEIKVNAVDANKKEMAAPAADKSMTSNKKRVTKKKVTKKVG